MANPFKKRRAASLNIPRRIVQFGKGRVTRLNLQRRFSAQQCCVLCCKFLKPIQKLATRGASPMLRRKSSPETCYTGNDFPRNGVARKIVVASCLSKTACLPTH